MKKQTEIEIKVGVFVAIGLVLLAAAVLILGSSENLTTQNIRYAAHFADVEGLVNGAKVVISGVQAGTVKGVGMDVEHRDIRVDISVAKSFSEWIREGSVASIATQGVLGDKFVTISTGSTDQPKLPENSEIPSQAPQTVAQVLSKGDVLMESITNAANRLEHVLKSFDGLRSEQFFQNMAVTAHHLASATEKLDREVVKNTSDILEKINNGTGTLGALVNDPALYDEAKALVGGANRNRVMRNLVRQTIRQSDEEAAAEEAKKKEKK